LPVLRPFFEAVHPGEIQIITSTLTLTEVLVLPYRTGNRSLALRYAEMLSHSQNVALLPVSGVIANEAARIRASYGYKAPDAIQLATALAGKATSFLTNDAALRSIPGLKTIFIKGLAEV
jgi:predicted nucleic acid-binding protein